ncbi:NrfD/PsrC family molybdoenzyme membrane anchor subunit [Ramlibacter sp. AN1015]|uniref:NrfD/PsrC family molybdoenzyme membrane anchor subunit n=1 Tax=Ramlibacter sp. AN1015 TaxID=3133428 RepID=UPI0030BD05D1
MTAPPPSLRYEGPTYHGQPMLKPSVYGALIWGYTWLAGLAGSSQVLATVADLSGRAGLRSMVWQGRTLAAFLPVIGAGLLVADLHTPQRFYNMLRIFRATSPMSIGSYVLSAFGFASAVTAWAGWTGREGLARASELPAATAGAGMSVYTAALLSATSTPLWSAAPRALAGQFAASAFATGAAALSIGQILRGDHATAARLEQLAGAAALVEFGFGRSAQRSWRRCGVDAVLHERGIRASRLGGDLLGVALPLACLAANTVRARRSPVLTVAGALGVLAGGLAMRAAVFEAGNRSAQRPQDAFAMARVPHADGQSDAPGRPQEAGYAAGRA